jgi:Fe-S cluster assembly iron-binding protein IscA
MITQRETRGLKMLTDRAAEQLKETLVDAYLRSGGLDRISISEQAERAIAQHLLKKCRESLIGFRLIMAEEDRLLMSIGTPRNGDDIYERNGLLLFADQSSAAVLDTYQLDYTECPSPSFVLRLHS